MTPYGDGTYRAEIFERPPGASTRVKRVELDKVTSAEASRSLNAVSYANVETAVPADEATQILLRSVRTIRFELDVWRDGDMIWSGPITRLRYTRNAMHIGAKDYLWWLGRRFVRHRVAFENADGGDGLRDLAEIAETVARSALGPEDPALLGYISYHPGAFGQARIERNDYTYAIEAWDQLTSQGLDYTALGRLIIVAGVELPVPPIPPLTDQDFVGELEVSEEGDEAATRAVYMGGGVAGVAGGTNGYFGLVERRFDGGSTLSDVSALNVSALDHVQARNPPPLLITIPTDGTLSPACQVSPQRWVPGAVAQVTVGYVLRPVAQSMRLAEVKFARRSGEQERVSVNLQPVGVLADATDR